MKSVVKLIETHLFHSVNVQFVKSYGPRRTFVPLLLLTNRMTIIYGSSKLQPSLPTVSPLPIGERARPLSGRSWVEILMGTADKYCIFMIPHTYSMLDISSSTVKIVFNSKCYNSKGRGSCIQEGLLI